MATANTLHADASAGGETKSFTRYLPVAARILVGLMFLVFGLNGFLHFIPEPKTPMPVGAAAFATALAKTGYMMPLVMGVQFIVAVLLLANRFVPLALALIFPIIVGIITFHLFLAPATIGPGIFVLLLELYLVWSYRNAFRPMLALRSKPASLA